MSALSELIRKSLPADTSHRQLAARSELSRATIDNYVKGSHPERPTDEVLNAFSSLLGISLPELREAAGRPRGERQPYAPPTEANMMSRRQRTAVTELIRSFVSEEVIGHGMEDATESDAPGEAQREDEEARPPLLDETQVAILLDRQAQTIAALDAIVRRFEEDEQGNEMPSGE